MNLYIVSTPIGNLKDITQRALEILRGVDLILAEDTRITLKLLNHYQISKPLLSYHQHSPLKRYQEIKNLLLKNKNIALVCDAGTPGIADPSGQLIQFLTQNNIPNLKIIPIPGPSALTAALSIAGFYADRFLFLGFPPTKNKRRKFFQRVIQEPETVIIYEGPHRILKTLQDLQRIMEEEKNYRQLVVCKELTKQFEKIYRDSIKEILTKLQKEKIRGEWIIILGPAAF